LKKRRVALVVAVIFTALSGLAFCLAIAAIVGSFYYRPTFETSGGGGIGAVSFGFAEFIIESLPLIAVAVFVNFSVTAEARQRGPAAVRFRRVHLLVIVLTIVSPPLLTVAFLAVIASGESHELFLALTLAGALGGAVLTAIHGAFGLFAIKLLRQQP
jgi:hypothetical protein